jgi:hypothetical protein
VITNQHEQYGGTVHLFIGTGRSLDKITFVSLIINYNHNANYQGLGRLFLFKSVPSFVLNMPSCRNSFNCSFGIYLHVVSACILSCRRCFCLEDLRRRRRPATCLNPPSRPFISFLPHHAAQQPAGTDTVPPHVSRIPSAPWQVGHPASASSS